MWRGTRCLRLMSRRSTRSSSSRGWKERSGPERVVQDMLLCCCIRLVCFGGLGLFLLFLGIDIHGMEFSDPFSGGA